ncbi:hypothetical protein DPMN_073451 [Dreissena polymorpha]|uniref:Uncharacterized protein n=1 Tax=Dreissena polymorpha TaxID=45954 RepID=A0A9D4HB23_DREPO|nr:hypothetical protein DPMN_073451 [Dreissena polymorpha]
MRRRGNKYKSRGPRVFTRKLPPLPQQPYYSTDLNHFELNSHIKETNVLTKFHENWAKNRKCPAHWQPCLSPIWTIFEFVRDINKTNVLTNFHDDWAKNVTSRVYTSHVIQLTETIFELNSHIKETNVLTKFHENWAKNVTSRVEKCPAHWRPCINKTNVLTNFHDDWAKIVTSRVFTRKTAPPPRQPYYSTDRNHFHVIQLIETIFELNSHIKETNKNAPAHWQPCLSPIWTIFEFVRHINKTNVLTNFHDDWAKIVTSRVFTRKTAPPPRQPYYSTDRNHFHVIQLIETIFELNSHIKETNVLTKFHENWAKKPCLSPIWTIFEFVRHINKTNVLTNFHDDWAKNVTSRVYTRKLPPPPPGSHETNVLTKFHENWAKNVTSRVFTCLKLYTYREKCPAHWRPCINKTNVFTNFHDDWAKIVTTRVFTRKLPPSGSHVIQLTGTIFELNSHIKETKLIVFTCFYYIHIEKNAPPTGGHVFSPIWTIFELVRDINKTIHVIQLTRIISKLNSHNIEETNALTKFQENWEKIEKCPAHWRPLLTRKTALPTGGHVFQRTRTTFELNQHIIKTNILTNLYKFFLFLDLLLTKFHEDRTINVASRVFTNKCGRTTDNDLSQKLT